MYRNTYAEINLKNIEYNAHLLCSTLNKYKYHIAVVKGDCYGHFGNEPIKAMIKGGVNYLAVSSLEEALKVREDDTKTPILCLGIIETKYTNICIENNVTMTINTYEEALELLKENVDNLKVHLKVNTGMNRLGIGNKDEFTKTYNLLKDKVEIEGIFTHMYDALNKVSTQKQINAFEDITSGINLSDVKIVHFGGSNYALNYPKLPYVNGVRYGISLYGLGESDLPFKNTFKLVSHVYQINTLENCTLGYGADYKVTTKEKIAVIPIGYSDGVLRANTKRDVYINNKRYPIVGRICMDMLFVKVDDTIKVGDEVLLLKDNEHIKEVAKYLNTTRHEVIGIITKRVPRVYIN